MEILVYVIYGGIGLGRHLQGSEGGRRGQGRKRSRGGITEPSPSLIPWENCTVWVVPHSLPSIELSFP